MDDLGLGARVGNFLVVIGVLVILIFVASDISNQPVFPLFCSGAALLGLGAFLRIRNAQPGESKPSGRFGLLRGGKKESKEAKGEKK
jgi:hypothetical protein